MEKLKIVTPAKASQRVNATIPQPEYEMIKEISVASGLSIPQVVGQVIRFALSEGYEIEEIKL